MREYVFALTHFLQYKDKIEKNPGQYGVSKARIFEYFT